MIIPQFEEEIYSFRLMFVETPKIKGVNHRIYGIIAQKRVGYPVQAGGKRENYRLVSYYVKAVKLNTCKNS